MGEHSLLTAYQVESFSQTKREIKDYLGLTQWLTLGTAEVKTFGCGKGKQKGSITGELIDCKILGSVIRVWQDKSSEVRARVAKASLARKAKVRGKVNPPSVKCQFCVLTAHKQLQR